jgi:hypothetical protein
MPLPRRPLTFSLRTLMVLVGAVCCWLAYEMPRVRARQAAIDKLRADSGNLILLAKDFRTWSSRRVRPQSRIAWYRSQFGDVAVAQIVIDGRSGDRERLSQLFPEAAVIRWVP